MWGVLSCPSFGTKINAVPPKVATSPRLVVNNFIVIDCAFVFSLLLSVRYDKCNQKRGCDSYACARTLSCFFFVDVVTRNEVVSTHSTDILFTYLAVSSRFI